MDSEKNINPTPVDGSIPLTVHSTAARIIFQQLEIMRQQIALLHADSGGVMKPQPADISGESNDNSMPRIAARQEKNLETPSPNSNLTEPATRNGIRHTFSRTEISHGAGPTSAPGTLSLTPGDNLKQMRFPVTAAQQEVWLASKLSDTASCAFNESTVFRFRGEFDMEAMQAAFRRIVYRHDALRITFDPSGETQCVHASMEFEIPLTDYAGIMEGNREEKISTVLAREVQTPFDLEHGPLFRVRIIKLSDKDHMMVVTTHHAVCDGWSFDVMVHDLSRAYSILNNGRSDDRPLPTLQFSEYAMWLKNGRDSAEISAVENYWLNQFADAIPVLDLPSDYLRPPAKSYHGDRVTQVLNNASYLQIRKMGARQGATLYSTLLAVFSILIYRLTGQSDFVVGMLAAGQSVSGSSDLVGHCTNLLPLRVSLSGRDTFMELLAHIKKIVLDAYDHQGITFGNLIRQLDIKRDPSRTPLVSVLFNIDPAIHGIKFNNLETEFSANPRCSYQFDLGFNLSAYENKMLTSCDYTPDLFSAETIHRWIGHYHTLIESIVHSPELSVDLLPILSESEQHQLLVEWNATEKEYPKEKTLVLLFEEQVERSPEAISLYFEGHQLTYRDLNTRSNQLAHYLSSVGVGPEVMVGLYMERSIEMVIGIYGIIKAGGAYVPLDPEYPADRISFMLEDTDVQVVLTQERLVAILPERPKKVICLDSDWDMIVKESTENPQCGINAENLAYVIYTSGSTGRPKGVLNEHRGIVNRLIWMQEQYRLSAADRVLQKTPFSFDVSVWEFFWPLQVGASLILAKPDGHKDSNYLVKLIREQKITTLHFVPSMLRIFLEEDGVEQCVSIKRVICSGEALPFDLQQRFFGRMGAELHNLYGPTEAAVDVTFWPCRPDHERSIVPIGFPIANTKTYILDRNLLPVPIGSTGELYIGGIQVARGYLNRPELTSEKFIKDPFGDSPASRLYKTGDLARYLPDGSIEYLGRVDFQVKVRGMRVELGEIESRISELDAVNKCVVLVREDVAGDQRLVAYYVVNPGSSVSISDWRDYLRAKLPDYMVPQLFVELESIPISPNGKVDRKALPKPDMEPISDKEYVPPRTEMERQIAAIWQEVLRLGQVGIQDDFFELGGHSLLAMQVLSRINHQFNIQFPFRRLFEARTVEALADAIDTFSWVDRDRQKVGGVQNKNANREIVEL